MNSIESLDVGMDGPACIACQFVVSQDSDTLRLLVNEQYRHQSFYPWSKERMHRCCHPTQHGTPWNTHESLSHSCFFEFSSYTGLYWLQFLNVDFLRPPQGAYPVDSYLFPGSNFATMMPCLRPLTHFKGHTNAL